jgi:hypothetical protein
MRYSRGEVAYNIVQYSPWVCSNHENSFIETQSKDALSLLPFSAFRICQQEGARKAGGGETETHRMLSMTETSKMYWEITQIPYRKT